MENGIDYLYNGKILMMSSAQPLKQHEGVMIGTKNYVFLIPQKTTGFYYLVTTFKTHQYFVNNTVDEGCRKLISEMKSSDELENAFINLLEDDSKYVHKLADKGWFKLNKFFKTYNFRMGKGKLDWAAFVVKGHDSGALIKSFYANQLQK